MPLCVRMVYAMVTCARVMFLVAARSSSTDESASRSGSSCFASLRASPATVGVVPTRSGLLSASSRPSVACAVFLPPGSLMPSVRTTAYSLPSCRGGSA